MFGAPISDHTTLIQAIQTLRQFQIQPEPPSYEDRKKWVERLAQVLRNPESKWVETLAEELQVSEETVRAVEFLGSAVQIENLLQTDDQSEKLKKSKAQREALLKTNAPIEIHLKPNIQSENPPKPPTQTQISQNIPRGLIAILSPRVFPIRLTLERLVPALLAGNVAMIKMSSKAPRACEVLAEILLKAQIPEKAVALTSASRLVVQPISTGHPAIRGVSFVGQHGTATEISKNLDHIRCRFQAWTGGVSSYLVMEESSLENASQTLRTELERWPCTSPFFPTKIFVADKFLEKARESLTGALAGLQLKTDSTFEKLMQEMKKETARVLRAEAPALLENLPNCSELQQVELQTPILQLTSVKYSYEMAKWVNNGDYGFRALVFGDDEKARKLASKLEVGSVSINKAFDPAQSFLFGVKEPAIGETHLASFFNQSRQISDV